MLEAARRHPAWAALLLALCGAAQTPAYVGRWAAVPTACGHEAWTFRPDGLQSPGGLSCSFVKADATTAGYVIQSDCRSAAGAKPSRLILTLTEVRGVRSLTLEGAPQTRVVALSRCG